MADNTSEKLQARETMTIEPVIDKHYQLIETKKAEEIIERAMNLAREEIPKALKVNTLTGKGSLEEVRLAISLALIQSMPIPDENEDGQGGGTGIMEIPKFIVIATAKFHYSEREAWEMTPRKFSLLNDAYRVINGLKKEEEYASLLALP